MQLFMQNRIDARTHSNAHCELVHSKANVHNMHATKGKKQNNW